MLSEEIERLRNLQNQGILTADEFVTEKWRLLTMAQQQQSQLFGLTLNQYLTVMHLSHYAGWLLPLGGWIVPIVLWLVGRDRHEAVDATGKQIFSWMLSQIIYCITFLILCFIYIGIPLLVLLLVIDLVCPFIAAIKASNGKRYRYPLTITFFQ